MLLCYYHFRVCFSSRLRWLVITTTEHIFKKSKFNDSKYLINKKQTEMESPLKPGDEHKRSSFVHRLVYL